MLVSRSSDHLAGVHKLYGEIWATTDPDFEAVIATPGAPRGPELLFDYFGVRLNGPKAEGKKLALNIDFTDLGSKYALVIENGALNYKKRFVDNADATVTLKKETLDNIELKTTTVDEAIASGDMKIDGSKANFDEFFGLLDTFPFWFNIVTP